MEFNCGLTNEAWEAKYKQWHRFFALWPRTVAIENGKFVCVWLETIERRADRVWYWDGRYVSWDYRRLSPTTRERSKEE